MLKNKASLYSVIIVVILVLNISQLIKNYNLKSENKSINNEFYNLKDQYSKLVETNLLYIKHNSFHLNDSLKFTGEDREYGLSEDLLPETPLLILRYPEYSCHICVMKQIKLLNNFVDEVGKENILLISAFRKIRAIKAFKRVNNIKYRVVYPDTNLNIFVESYAKPYFFVLSKDQKAKHVFIPDEDNPELTNKYLQYIHQKYFAEHQQ